MVRLTDVSAVQVSSHRPSWQTDEPVAEPAWWNADDDQTHDDDDTSRRHPRRHLECPCSSPAEPPRSAPPHGHPPPARPGRPGRAQARRSGTWPIRSSVAVNATRTWRDPAAP